MYVFALFCAHTKSPIYENIFVLYMKESAEDRGQTGRRLEAGRCESSQED